MTNVQFYEFQRLKRRFDCFEDLLVFIEVIQMISIAVALLSMSNTLFNSNKTTWIIVSWISIIVAFSCTHIMGYISRILSNCEREIKKAKITGSMTTEWKQVEFSKTNFMDFWIRKDNVSTVFIRKNNAQCVDVKCYLKRHKKGKKYIQYTIYLDTAMDVFDLSDFLV